MLRSVRTFALVLVALLATRGHAQPPVARRTTALGAGLAAQRPLQQVIKVGNKLRAAGTPVRWQNRGIEIHAGDEHYYEYWNHGEHGSTGSVTSLDMKKRLQRTVTLTLDDRGRVKGAVAVTSHFDATMRNGNHHAVVERPENGERVVRSERFRTGDAPSREPMARGRAGADGAKEENQLSTSRIDARGTDSHLQLIRSLYQAPSTEGAAPRDVALGTERTSGRVTLDQFGATIGASIYRTWGVRKLATNGSARIDQFSEQFHDAMTQTIERGGRIKYDLTDIEVTRALATAGDAVPNKGLTAWELRQVLANPKYRAATDFYLQDKNGDYHKLDEQALRGHGIEPTTP